MQVDLPIFGTLDLTSGAETYDAEIEIDGRSVSLDLNCLKGTPPPQEGLRGVRRFAHDLVAWRDKSLTAIRGDFEAGGEAAYYADESLEILDKDSLAQVLKGIDKNQPVREQILDALRLIRVGFYPDPQLYPKDESFAVFDFTIGPEFADFLLVVKYGANTTLLGIDYES